MNTDDCGCDTSVDLNTEDIDRIKTSMSETKSNLERMLSQIENLNVDFKQFDKLENQLNKVSNFFETGEYAKSMERIIEMAKTNMSSFNPSSVHNMVNPFANTNQGTKEPIGYVWLDENGEQKFSPAKPEDIISMPVYGE